MDVAPQGDEGVERTLAATRRETTTIAASGFLSTPPSKQE
jgi:hypothetical protein